jgi:cytochrome c peroxidase
MRFHRVLVVPGLSTFALLVIVAAAPLAHAQQTQTDDPLLTTARSLFEPIPDGPAILDDNPYTPEKDLLGRTLFFDPRLSASWALSCNSCHNMGLAGVDLQPTSIGHGWQRGGRNSPTVLNSAFNIAQFWDGRAEDLAVQAMGPIQDALEMNSTPELVIETLNSMPDYVEMFESAFPEQDDPVSFENVAIAIEVFESTLLTPDAPFDLFLKGDADALDPNERAGLELFVQRGCVACHGGVNLGGTGYFPFGVVERPDAFVRPEDDLGRYAVTNVEADKYAFKSPSLRNIELTPPYFHSGSIWSLEDAVRLMGTAQLGADLSDDEVAKITAFLATLTGEQPVVDYPVMPMISDTTPLPVPMTVP